MSQQIQYCVVRTIRLDTPEQQILFMNHNYNNNQLIFYLTNLFISSVNVLIAEDEENISTIT